VRSLGHLGFHCRRTRCHRIPGHQKSGYRDIKKAAKKAAEGAIVAKLKEYPDAAEMQKKFMAVDEVLTDMLRRRELLSKVRPAPSILGGASKKKDSAVPKEPSRYPPKGD
jgi:hypothetical protein